MPFPKFLSSSVRRGRKEVIEAPPEVKEDLTTTPECCWLRALSFEDTLDNPELRSSLRQFLESRRRCSALSFWSEIRSFKSSSMMDSGYECPSPPQRSDALRIYQKFVSPEGSSHVPLPTDVTHIIIKGICSENPTVDPECFTPAENLLYSSLSNEDFSEFLRSSTYAQYLLLRQDPGPSSIRDILANEALLCRFTEFLEAEGDKKDSLSFWMAVNHFHEQPEALQGDALIIYEKYISMQATHPLGFSNEIRSRIEEQICVDSGVGLDHHLFDSALRILVQSLDAKYLRPFLNSSLFQNYISELKSTISSPAKSPWANKGASLYEKRSASISSLASSSSDISTQNTLLAMSKAPSSSYRLPKSKSDVNGKMLNVDSLSMDSSSWDPNHIWRSMSSLSSPRRSSSSNMGEIDHLGRYISHFESPPPPSIPGPAAAGSSFTSDPLIRNISGNSKLHRVMRVLGVGPEVPIVTEQLAWHEAEIIVKDILNLTSSSANSPISPSPPCDKQPKGDDMG